MAAAKGDQPCIKFNVGATKGDRETVISTARTVIVECLSSPWFSVPALGSGVGGMVGSGTHLYQDH